MPKHDVGRGAKSSAAARGRRPATAAAPAARLARPSQDEPPPRRRSPAGRLASEVERLERELAIARARVAELAARADIDPLTEVLNRRGFERELRRSLAYVKRYGASAALVYFDLDGFKSINDRHGHAAGDAMLKAVAAVLVRHVRASDLVARLGGDEFAVLLWHLSEADAERKARALAGAIERTTATHAGRTFAVGVSVGVALLLPPDAPAEVLERADRAMYARKAKRKSARPAG